MATRCVLCEAEGVSYAVTSGVTTSSMGLAQTFYDEADKRHERGVGERVGFRCSNGHEWSEAAPESDYAEKAVPSLEDVQPSDDGTGPVNRLAGL